jgi:hypothetical protein
MFGFLSPMAWKALGVLVFLALVAASAGRFGYRLADGQWQAREAERLVAEAQALAEDRARALAVAAAYEGVRAELARLAAVKRVEVMREVEKPVYRDCVLPESGRVLVDAAQDRAGAAAPGAGGPVRGPGEAPGR